MDEQFAMAMTSPRSIAWGVKGNDWKHLETVIKYNCAMLGGYFNVMFPLSDNGRVSSAYQHFLADYDPDFIVLPPGIDNLTFDAATPQPKPFAELTWNNVNTIAALDPWTGGSGINATPEPLAGRFFEKSGAARAFAATASLEQPEESKFALLACGDVEPRQPMWDVFNGEVELHATGYREVYLRNLLKPNYDVRIASAHMNDGDQISAPDRYRLSELVNAEFQFPLSDTAAILETSFLMQHFLMNRGLSLICLTADYKRSAGTPPRKVTSKNALPGAVILVSDELELEEAILFWNLRASEVNVVWLSFARLTRDLDTVIKWFNADSGGSYYMMTRGLNVALSCPAADEARLQTILQEISNSSANRFLEWEMVTRSELAKYNYIRPSISAERTLVAQSGSTCTFMPPWPDGHRIGALAVDLVWNGLMVPPNPAVVREHISSATMQSLVFVPEFRHLILPKVRIGIDRYLRIQLDAREPITFNQPTAEHLIDSLILSGGATRIEQSSTAKYHAQFVARAGGLSEARQLLTEAPYRTLLELLADGQSRSRTGWLLDHPDKRRVLNHLQLRDVLGADTPSDTRTYFNTVSDELPREATALLEKDLLERGFVLACRFCSFRSWYRVDHVGQTYECARCLQAQVYTSNPLWLYKLPEVTFQGFADNMQVPLLALFRLSRTSKHSFMMAPDSNIRFERLTGEGYRNVDILCLCDGRLIIGEAKSNDEIDQQQMAFYEKLCREVSADAVVFATSASSWNRATSRRIESFAGHFPGDVIIFTSADLYGS